MEDVGFFKRLNDDKVVLDGIVWSRNFEKMIAIRNDENGNIVHSIKMNGTYYYPVALVPQRKNKDN